MKVAARSVAVAVAMLAAGSAQAASYPDHPVKIVVPFAPAGPTDVMARLIAQKLSESLKQQFYVENHPGAGGNIGMVQVAKSAPDGYTILVASSSYVVNPEPLRKEPLRSVQGLRAGHARCGLAEHPGGERRLSGQVGEGTRRPRHEKPWQIQLRQCPAPARRRILLASCSSSTFKLDLATVPFNGAGPAIQSAVAGHTPVALTALPPTAPQVQAGKLRGLAVTSTKRSSALPDVPTMAEAGVTGQESETMQGIFVPAGTPKDVGRSAEPRDRKGNGVAGREGEMCPARI